MAPPRMQVLLVSLPGLVREATSATLAYLSNVSLIATASGALSATHLLQDIAADLLLVDANLPDEEVKALLGWARQHRPEMQCLVMTMTTRQRHQALAWGADAAIQRSDLSDQLPAVLSQLPAKWLDEQPLAVDDSL